MGMNTLLTACGICLLLKHTTGLTDIDYMDQVCDTSVYVSEGRALESHTNIIYSSQMSCYYRVTVPTNYKVQAVFKRFVLESEVNGACVDYVDVHDGSSVGSTKLNSASMCGTKPTFTMASSGTDMTIYFKTDATGNTLGFFIIFTAFSTAPCISTQFACTNNICVASSMQCDNLDNCGDNSDEDNCPVSGAPGVYNNPDTPLIIGLTVGLTILLIVAGLIGYFCWRYNRWRLFLRTEIKKPKIPDNPATFNNTYPVTKRYYQEKYQKHFKDVERPYGEEWRNDRAMVLRELSGKTERESASANGTGHTTTTVTQTNTTPEPEIERRSFQELNASGQEQWH